MAPVKKKRVWNFSIEIHPRLESPPDRKRLRLVHAGVRRHCTQQRSELQKLISSEVQSIAKIKSVAAWQLLRYVPPATKEEQIKRQSVVRSILTQKLAMNGALARVYGKVEASLLQSQSTMCPARFSFESSKSCITTLSTSITKDAEVLPATLNSVNVSSSVPLPNLQSLHPEQKSENDLCRVTDSDKLYKAEDDAIVKEIRVYEGLAERISKFLLNRIECDSVDAVERCNSASGLGETCI